MLPGAVPPVKVSGVKVAEPDVGNAGEVRLMELADET
jgi:hypothetical protein